MMYVLYGCHAAPGKDMVNKKKSACLWGVHSECCYVCLKACRYVHKWQGQEDHEFKTSLGYNDFQDSWPNNETVF